MLACTLICTPARVLPVAIAGKKGREESLDTTSVPDPRSSVTREKAALSGYDHLGGSTSLLPTRMADHFGYRPAPNTATSGTVSGEAWDAAHPSQMTVPARGSAGSTTTTSTSTGTSAGTGSGGVPRSTMMPVDSSKKQQ